MFSNINANLEIVKGAYKKLKSYYYYNKNFLKIRKRIADFEMDESTMKASFLSISEFLAHPDSSESKAFISNILKGIDYIALPKKADILAPYDSSINSNSIIREKTITAVNFFIDCNIELYIIDTIWTIYLAKIAHDNQILTYSVFGNTINEKGLFSYNTINFDNRILFNRYFERYASWRNQAYDALEQNYQHKKDSLLVSLDIESYFYSVSIDFSNLSLLFGDHILFSSITPLSSVMEEVYSKYSAILSKLSKLVTKLPSNKSILPIGLFSSMVLGNVYLSDFDKKVQDVSGLLYYGRYVDDMLFVFDKTIDHKLSPEDIISEFFEQTGLLENFEGKYVIKGRPLSCIQQSKLKFLYISNAESHAIIDIFNKQVRLYPSQMEHIPFYDTNLYDFNNSIYNNVNSGSATSLIDYSKAEINRMNLGLYFSSLGYGLVGIRRSETDRKTLVHNHIKQIERFLNHKQLVEFYNIWVDYFYFLVLDGKSSYLMSFLQKTKDNISSLQFEDLDKKKYLNRKAILKRLMDSLFEHLSISLCLALCLDIQLTKKHFNEYSIEVQSFIHSNMFKHHYLTLPLSNYMAFPTNVPLKTLSINQLGSYPKNILHSHKFTWSPRFIHYHEILLAMFYSNHNYKKKKQWAKLQEQAYKDFCAVNGIKNPFTIKHNRPVSMCGERYSLYRTVIPSNNLFTPSKVNIAIGSILLKPNHCLGLNNTNEVKKDFNRLLKETYDALKTKMKTNKSSILVLPELYLPIDWLKELIDFSKRTQIAVVTGLQYVPNKNDVVTNYLATILPFTASDGKYKNAYVNIRSKNDYSPKEFKGLAKTDNNLHLHCIDNVKAVYNVFNWNKIDLASLVCYEITDVTVRALLKGSCDIIALSVFNPDTAYFSNIIESTTRDLQTFILQANTSLYGDSRVTAPYDKIHKDIYKNKGGDNVYVVVGSIELNELVEFKKSYFEDLDKKVQSLLNDEEDPKNNNDQDDSHRKTIKDLSAGFKRNREYNKRYLNGE